MKGNMFANVAKKAHTYVLETWNSFLDEDNHDEDDCEQYLYVFADGSWTIDHCQYFTGWNDIVTLAPVSNYSCSEELEEELELNSHEVCVF